MGDVNPRTEEGVVYSVENIGTQHWLRGHTSGLEAGAEWIKAKAVKLFEAGKYEEARQLRELAVKMIEELRPKMEQRAEEHAKDFPEIIKFADGSIPDRSRGRGRG